MLNNGNVAGSQDKDARRGNIKQVQLVSSGAADIDKRFVDCVAVERRFDGMGEEFRGKAGNFGSSLTLFRESFEKVGFGFVLDGIVENRFGR